MASIGPAVSEEKMFEHCERWTGGRVPDHGYTCNISSPMNFWLRLAKHLGSLELILPYSRYVEHSLLSSFRIAL